MKIKDQKKKQGEKKKSGFVLPAVLVFASFFLVIFTGLLVFVGGERELSIKEVERGEALEIAEAGVSFYSWHITRALNGKNAAQVSAYWQNVHLGVPNYEREVKDPQGKPRGRFNLEVTPPVSGSTVINLRVTGWSYLNPTAKRIINVVLRRPAWSEYAVIANDVMRFGDGTEVWGPIHSNGGIRFDGVAHNLVTSAKTTYTDPDTGQTKDGVWTGKTNPTQVFLAGKRFPVPIVDFNGLVAELSAIKEAAQGGQGIYLDYAGSNKAGYHLILKNDKVDIYVVTSRNSTTHQITKETFLRTDNLPNAGVIFVEDDVTVEGKLVNKKITLGCADLARGLTTYNIYIEKSIIYDGYDGTELLGLVAQGSIKVGLYSEDDLRVDGALVAQNGNIGRDYYDSGDSNQYYKRNSITLYGALATNKRYGFSWICGGTYCSGYKNRIINFDPNLMYNTAPFFPSQNSYKIDRWEEGG